jgi:hypothetical protein
VPVAAGRSSAGIAITRIIGVRTDQQVIWPYTVADIARMADKDGRRQVAVTQHPRKPMDTPRRIAVAKKAVPVRAVSEAASPQPATISLLDFRPEPRKDFIR